MEGAPEDPSDRTVRVPQRAAPRAAGRLHLAVAALLLLAALGAGGYWWLRPAPPPAPIVAPAPAFPIRTADEVAIRADQPDGLTVFRFAPNPRVLVLDFASLREQGRMLNRVAALVEKAGLPRDRVLTDPELEAAIRAGGDTDETWYYGHDYRAADLVRFFALADRDHVHLTPEEEKLRGLVRQEGWESTGATGALISIPRRGANETVDAAARATILHHELSHGEYFTNAGYAAYARRFWETDLTGAERDLFRRFLARDGYDTGNDDLVINEMQAYLMHTRDPRFFSAAVLGIRPDRLEELRAAFLRSMPAGWLRDSTPVAEAAQPVPARAPRRRQRRGSVSRTRASPARRPPRLRASSIAA